MVKDKNPESKNGFTPLHIAAHFGHLNICKMIIDVTENPIPFTNRGSTPVELSAQNIKGELGCYVSAKLSMQTDLLRSQLKK